MLPCSKDPKMKWSLKILTLSVISVLILGMTGTAQPLMRPVTIGLKPEPGTLPPVGTILPALPVPPATLRPTPAPLAPGLPVAPVFDAPATTPNLPDLSQLPGPMSALPPLPSPNTPLPAPAPLPARPVVEINSMVVVAAFVGEVPVYRGPSTSAGSLGVAINGAQGSVLDTKIGGSGQVEWYYVRWTDEDFRAGKVIATFNRTWISAVAVRPVPATPGK
jgi:hypothetical protein